MRWRVLCVAFLAAACGSAPPQARHEGGDRRYRAVVEAAAAPAGSPAVLGARVEPRATWRLATELPASLVVEAPEGLRRRVDARDAGTEASGERLVFEVPLPAERPGEAELAGVLRFAVCRGLLCERVDHPFRVAVR